MDGVEWRRDKWNAVAKIWFYINEFVGSHLANIPIADHPEIAKHLRRHGCNSAQVIPYGSARVETADVGAVEAMGLSPANYLISIARIEPENSILEIVSAFASKPRDIKLVVLGNFRQGNAYHEEIKATATKNVIFPGAIYDKSTVEALRVHALAYMHGHQVGGTNPSLVEALGTGSAVIAHDNRFNRWVAGEGQFYFNDTADLERIIDAADAGTLGVGAARLRATSRHAEAFTFNDVHRSYELLLEKLL